MITGLTTAVDFDGVPFVLADERTPFEAQRKAMELLIAGLSPLPPNAIEVRLWHSERGVVRKWMAPVKTATKPEPQPITPPKKMKKFLALIAFAAGLFAAAEVQAQLASTAPSLFQIPATTISNLASPIVLDIRRQQNVAVLVSSKQATGSDTSVIGYKFVPSVDGTTEAAAPALWLAKAANGTTAVTISTNFASLGGYPYLILTQVTNGAATVLTNLSVKYWVKPDAP